MFSHSSMIQSSVQKPDEWLILSPDGSIQTMCDLFDTSHQSIHLCLLSTTLPCDLCPQWKKQRLTCPYCRQVTPLKVVEGTYPQLWQEDTKFVAQVKRAMMGNPFWYGICRDENGTKEGFFAQMPLPIKPSDRLIVFLGHTKSGVLPHIKACLKGDWMSHRISTSSFIHTVRMW